MALLVDSPVKVGAGPVIGRGALRLGNVAQVEAGTLARAASLRLAVALRGLVGIGGQKAARLAMAARAAVLVMGPGRVARGVTIVKDLRRIDVGAARALRGPGESVGEVVHALPGALAGYPLPVGYIGRKLAALAVARGHDIRPGRESFSAWRGRARSGWIRGGIARLGWAVRCGAHP